MINKNCEPQYDYRPATFVASSIPCSAPSYNEHRSRLTINNLFFRSKNQGTDENLLSLECTSNQFKVYYNGTLQETFNIFTVSDGSIAFLRNIITTSSNLIEMPVLNFDIYDSRTFEYDSAMEGTPSGVIPFSTTTLVGGEGGPTTSSGISTIRTGPSRTVIIIRSTEDITGFSVTPSASKRIQQWDGENWISYCNLAQGECPNDGIC